MLAMPPVPSRAAWMSDDATATISQRHTTTKAGWVTLWVRGRTVPTPDERKQSTLLFPIPSFSFCDLPSSLPFFLFSHSPFPLLFVLFPRSSFFSALLSLLAFFHSPSLLSLSALFILPCLSFSSFFLFPFLLSLSAFFLLPSCILCFFCVVVELFL